MYRRLILSVLALSAFLFHGAAQPSVKVSGNSLTVDGKPFIMLAGELHNSTTGSVGGMEGVFQRMADKNLNTVIAAASWELVEPKEGKFDFKEVDAMIDGAAKAGVKLVILWFGSWKNGQSTYVPAWVKTDTKKYPRALFSDGSMTSILSALGENSMKADAKAFAAMMAHIRDYDRNGTVLMVQVENEIGTLDMISTYMRQPNRGMRDCSPAAEKAFKGKVPSKLMEYLSAHKGSLHPAIDGAWKRGGYRTSGTWEEVFGKGTLTLKEGAWEETFPYITEEIFNTWNYATYVGYVAQQGKKEYDIPMFVNAWLKQASQTEPGKYPSGGPNPHVFDIWRAGAPSIDFFAADIYATDIYDWVCSTFKGGGNPLFIPETKTTPDGASRAFYTFGKYAPLCYSPFGIDGGGMINSADVNDHSYDKTYGLLSRHMDEIRSHTPGVDMDGLLIDPAAGRNSDSMTLGGYSFSISPMNFGSFAAVAGVEAQNSASAGATDVSGVLVIKRAEGEFLVLGGVGGCTLRVSSADGAFSEILSVDEIRTDASGSGYLHRLNGDETSMGTASFQSGKAQAFLIKMHKPR
ncbi:MAG: beta-galactosidase [Bacteroidales bacterium]|nr:beta-galactosidase [Bacteroidales bacterium]